MCEGLYHVLGGDRALDLYAQALPAVLIHHWHHLQPSALLGLVHHEVVAPYVVQVRGPLPRASVLALAQEASPFALLVEDLQALLPRQSMPALLVERPTCSPQHRRCRTIAGAGVLP